MIPQPTAIPAAAGSAVDRRPLGLAGLALLAGAAVNAAAVLLLARLPDPELSLDLGGLGLALEVRLEPSALPFLAGLAGLGLVVAPFLARALRRRDDAPLLAAATLLTLGALEGAVAAGDVFTLLLSWEGALLPLALLLALSGGRGGVHGLCAFSTLAMADLALLGGLGVLEAQAGSGRLGGALPPGGAAGLGLALTVLGVAGRAGAFPFHGWLPGAAEAVPAPVLALVTAGQRLGAAALLTRVMAWQGGSGPAAPLLAILGAVSLLAALALLLADPDRRRWPAHLALGLSGHLLLAAAAGAPLAWWLAVAGAAAVALVFLLSGLARAPAALPASRAPRLLAAAEALDPARLARAALDAAALVTFALDRLVDGVLEHGVAGGAHALGGLIRRAHDGNHARYLAWALLGVLALLAFLQGGR